MPVPNGGQNAQALASHNNTVLYCDWFVNSSGSLDTADETIVLADFTIASESGYAQFTIPLGTWTGDGSGVVSPTTDPIVTASTDWSTPITGHLYHDGTDVWGWDYLRNVTSGTILSGGKLLVSGETIGADI